MNVEKWEYPACAICGTKKFIKIYYPHVTSWEFPGVFSFVQCSKCKLVFQSPRAPQSEVSQYYTSDQYWGWGIVDQGKDITSVLNGEKRYREVYKEIFARFPKPATILDIGTGTGLFLKEFIKRNWKVWGTDISKDAVQYAKNNFQIPMKVGDITTISYPGKTFDVISLNQVLEHVYEPYATLKKVHELLNKEGVLIIQIPNIQSLGFVIFGSESFHLQPGRHLYHFSPSTIELLLKKTGFRIDMCKKYDWTHDYHGLFNIIRYRFSPKFKKNPSGGLSFEKKVSISQPSRPSIIKEIGKMIARIIAFVVAIIERIIGRGEVMIIFARKI